MPIKYYININRLNHSTAFFGPFRANLSRTWATGVPGYNRLTARLGRSGAAYIRHRAPIPGVNREKPPGPASRQRQTGRGRAIFPLIGTLVSLGGVAAMGAA